VKQAVGIYQLKIRTIVARGMDSSVPRRGITTLTGTLHLGRTLPFSPTTFRDATITVLVWGEKREKRRERREKN
jgi:hypothetical protein